MIDIRKFTIKQMLLAAGIAREINRSSLVPLLGISESYYTKEMKDNNFLKLTESFRLMPKDKDLIVFKGISTLYMLVGKYLYTLGENKNE